MANRYIPFGYEIQNAEIVIVNQEALLVKSAFELYIAGKSYKTIADRFEMSGIYYNKDSAKWNKNMVKRMIENEKYTGTDEYPPIIDEKQYHKANRVRLSKNIKADSDKMDYDKFCKIKVNTRTENRERKNYSNHSNYNFLFVFHSFPHPFSSFFHTSKLIGRSMKSSPSVPITMASPTITSASHPLPIRKFGSRPLIFPSSLQMITVLSVNVTV